MELFTHSALPFPAGLGPRARQAVWPVLSSLTRLRELNTLYDAVAHLRGAAFIDAVLRQLGITIDVDPVELNRLPRHGAFVAVANHPSGMLDGLVLLHLLLRARPELRAVATERLKPLETAVGEHLVLVQTDPDAAARNTPRLRHLLRHLHNDIPLLLFPAGEVAHSPALFQPSTDPAWHPTARRLLTVTPVPVVPIWLSGHNSAAFSWLGLVHPLLRTARLPAELLNKRGQTVRVRIGHPVAASELRRLPEPEQLPYLRARVFALGAPCVAPPDVPPMRPPVAPEIHPTLVRADLDALRPGRCLLQTRQWEVYEARAAEIPNALREIGRLRELTFRAVGEGTGRPLDLDAYDRYYRHLLLYDRERGLLVGAYRLGPGRAILRCYGKRGLYLHSLFRLKKGIKPLLRESVELGRSWVRAEYQRQPLPLALLWKGISAWLARHPEVRYLIGPVSISNHFSSVSKAVLTEYLTRHCFDAELARHVRPRKQFRYRPVAGTAPTDAPPGLLGAGLDSLDALSRLIADIEPAGRGLPVLLRQYLRQNGRLIGFNLDPAFSNALDGFLVLRAGELPGQMQRLLARY